MKWNTIFRKLIPNEDKFFPILNDMSSNLLKCSQFAVKLSQSKTLDERREIQRTIKFLETKGDGLVGVLYQELNNTFITPFDREDMHVLADDIDNVLDRIHSTSKRVIMYEPKRLSEHFAKMSGIINEQCSLILTAISELKNVQKNLKSIKEICDHLHFLENQADDLYEHFITDIFEQENPDILELMKEKEIMQELERTTDDADNVGKAIKTIVVKFA
jgi:predicted phosphate transport protein (TIGR00153 family)